MPISDAHLALCYVGFFDLTTRVSGKFATIRSLKIAELNDGDRCFGIAFEMASFANQERHYFLVPGLPRTAAGRAWNRSSFSLFSLWGDKRSDEITCEQSNAKHYNAYDQGNPNLLLRCTPGGFFFNAQDSFSVFDRSH